MKPKIHNYSSPTLRFWVKVDKAGKPHPTLGPCWDWRGRKWKRYGCLTVNGKKRKAHRFSWTLHRGPIAKGLRVCHKCDNPVCVRPSHLFLGTDKDNLSDMAAKGRANRGEDRPASKLTEEQVRDIRQRYKKISKGHGNGAALAREYGVSKTAILYLVQRRNWNYLK